MLRRSTLGFLILGVYCAAGNAAAQPVTEYPIPTPLADATGITLGPDGNMWFTEASSGKIGRITKSGLLKEFPISPGAVPKDITEGAGGFLWFTEAGGNKIARLNPADGSITELPVPTPSASPLGITVGPGSRIWFTELTGNQIGRVNSDDSITEFPIPTAGSDPVGIAWGSDGNIWFTEETGNQLGRVNGNGSISEFPVPTPGAFPYGMTVGPDGNIWFTEISGRIGRLNPNLSIDEFPVESSGIYAITGFPEIWFGETNANHLGRVNADGSISYFPIPTDGAFPYRIAADFDSNIWFTEEDISANGIGRLQLILQIPVPTANVAPNKIAIGPDGNPWFTEHQGKQIGRVNPDLSITEIPVPSYTGFLDGIAAHANVWFAESTANKLARLNVNGSISDFMVPTASAFPTGLTLGPDGNFWFTEGGADRIGRSTPAGSMVDFPVPTTGAGLVDITTGPDGNLWFTEASANNVGRSTPAGSITEFPVITPVALPDGIASGPDGNLWFTENFVNQIGRITTSGSVTEFSVPTNGADPRGMTAGLDGNLWFTEGVINQIGRVTTAGKITEYPLPPAVSFLSPTAIAADLDGNLWITEFNGNNIDRLIPPGTTLVPTSGPASGGTPIGIAGTDFGPSDVVTIGGVAAADLVPMGNTRMSATTPHLAPGTLYDLKIVRPDGSMSIGLRDWLADFLDVPQADIFHDYVERISRHQITAGCGGGNYCRGVAATRAQMAVFLLKSEHGSHYVPPACAGVFPDVPCPSPFADWIEQLDAEGITGGCGGGDYCPNASVTRQQMAVLLLKTVFGPTYMPPGCHGVFSDVACPGPFTNWIEKLYAEGVTGGCASGPLRYCPTNPVTRGQIAVFLVKNFSLN